MKKIIFICLYLFSTCIFSCTHFRLTAEDSSVIIGRSMEFGPKLKTDIYTVNRGTKFESTTPDGKQGLHWQTKHGYLALDGLHLFPVSGINEQGLSFDLLYFPGLAKYEAYNSRHASESMPYYLIADYLLGNFANVDEIKKSLPKVNVYTKALNHQGQSVVFPVHYIITDKQGESIAVEYSEGKLNIYDDKTGILTNSPSYPWQTTNLKNFVNLSPYIPEPIVEGNITYSATGQGAGSLGLPGDYTPPSRFVKTAYLVRTSKQMPNAAKTVNLAQHILNNFDIPSGAIRGMKGQNSNEDLDETQWVIIKDLTHKIVYFRSYFDLTLQKIDMSKLEFKQGSPKLRMILVDDHSNIIDATNRFKKS
jgi:choloylglycine hydrolase